MLGIIKVDLANLELYNCVILHESVHAGPCRSKVQEKRRLSPCVRVMGFLLVYGEEVFLLVVDREWAWSRVLRLLFQLVFYFRVGYM